MGWKHTIIVTDPHLLSLSFYLTVMAYFVFFGAGFGPCGVKWPVWGCCELVVGWCQELNQQPAFCSFFWTMVTPSYRVLFLHYSLRGFHWWVRPAVRPVACQGFSNRLAEHFFCIASYKVWLLVLHVYWCLWLSFPSIRAGITLKWYQFLLGLLAGWDMEGIALQELLLRGLCWMAMIHRIIQGQGVCC